MGHPLRFVHSSDFNLHQPCSGFADMPDAIRRSLLDAPYRAARNVFDTAIGEGVDFVLLAGNLVAAEKASPRAFVFLQDQFTRLSEHDISVYWACGPQDREDLWPAAVELPANVTRFSSKQAERLLHRQGDEPAAQIIGLSAGNKKNVPLDKLNATEGGLFSIGLAHGNVNANHLAKQAVDFLALGGETTHTLLQPEPRIAQYAGSPQGRTPQQSQRHGCTLVEVNSAEEIRNRQVETEVLRFVNQHIPVTATTSREDLENRLIRSLENMADQALDHTLILTWHISGTGPLVSQLRHSGLSAELLSVLRGLYSSAENSVWSASLEVQTAAIDEEEYLQQESLLGDFLRKLETYRDEDERSLDLKPYLPYRFQDDSLAEQLALSTSHQKETVLDDAARLGIDLLSGAVRTKSGDS